jgi:hypothetical protein
MQNPADKSGAANSGAERRAPTMVLLMLTVFLLLLRKKRSKLKIEIDL